ncbi:MAG: tetratricopeptide repeat protein [Betaproteobacteria bacterium]|nr:tetratricopeptide repeat protein [Betaproteobacteria bacterium]
MSLINRMLQDLEARRAADPGDMLSKDVRPLPATREASWLRPVALLAVGAAVVMGGFMLWTEMQEWPAPPPSVPVAKPIVAAPVAPPPAPVPVQPVPAEAAPLQPVAVPAAAPASAPPATPAVPVAPTPAEAAKAMPSAKPAPAVAPAAPKAEAPVEERELKVATSISLPREAQQESATARPTRKEPAAPAVIEKKVRNVPAKERAESEYRKALGLLNQGRQQDALAGFVTALQTDPAHVYARVAAANLLAEQQRSADALALLEEGLGVLPGQPQLAMRMARLQIERGDLRGAADTLQAARGGGSGNAEYHALHAAVLQRLTFHKEAVTEYQAALRLAPQAGVWWMGLGISLEADGRGAEAREAYQRARASGTLSAELDRFVEQKLRQLQ